MAQQYAVTQDALKRFSKTAQDRARRLREIRQALGKSSPSANAFGKLPESEETGQEYRERSEETLKNLDFAAEQQDQIAELITKTARSYQEAEDQTADQLNAIAAEARWAQ
jgi:Spy/CpxP family protein refolding chaperone